MYLSGQWYPCDDGIIRPVLIGRIQCADGQWIAAEFLIDSGADRTVFVAPILEKLGLQPHGSKDGLTGLGGVVGAIQVVSTIAFTTDDGRMATYQGEFSALLDPEATDMCILGRDIISEFALIVDQPGNRVCLINQRHEYQIVVK